MVVVFFGTPQFAVPTLQHLLESSHTVSAVVTQPDRPRGRGQKVVHAPIKSFALDRRIPVFQPDRLRPPEVADVLRGWNADLGVVTAYGRIIPEHLLAVPRLGMINVHASLLPRYRGAAPVHRAVIDGEQETGVTIMRVVKELDAGGMFAKVTRPIGSDETSDVIEASLAEMGARLLVEVVDQLAAGTAHEEPQDDTQATYAPRLTKEEGLIDWTQSAWQIHNRVRGLYPWPHAYAFLNGSRLILLRSAVGTSHERLAHKMPGTILDVTSEAIHVATRDGEIAILDVQPEGRRAMRVHDFVLGHRIRPGDVFMQS
jgi:methionyl-tRNA formyltransferase